MKMIKVRDINIDNIPSWIDLDYIDKDLILYSDVKELPLLEDILRPNMATIVVCHSGRMDMDVNASRLGIVKNDIFVCLPNAYIADLCMSSDIECSIICLSERIITEFLPESKLWDRLIMLSSYPIIHVKEQKLEIMEMYVKIMKAKVESPDSGLRREILYSIIRTCMLELLEQLDVEQEGSEKCSRGKVLFWKFMKLLSGTEVKPRLLSYYADKLCVTSKYLSSTCKEFSGKPAHAWITEYVMNDIRMLLTKSDKSIKEIADYLQFPNQSFFGKYVKENTGFTPGQYREILIKNRKQQ